MLHKDHISQIQIYSPEWDQARLGRFTSSRIHFLMSPKGFGDGAETYIYHKVGEELTGRTTAEDDQIEDENTLWGLENEPAAIRKFHDIKQVEFLVTQKLIFAPGKRFSSTPDAIWIHSIFANQFEYNVSTLEVKCPRKFHRFIKHFKCKTPEDIKSRSPIYYWQVLDQMDNCGSAIGYLFFFHPLFPEGCNFRLIEFRKIDLWGDFKLLKDRKQQAVDEFDALRTELLNL